LIRYENNKKVKPMNNECKINCYHHHHHHYSTTIIIINLKKN